MTMDRKECAAYKDEGALLLVSQPSGEKGGKNKLIRQIRAWIGRAESLNGNREVKPFIPAIRFLSTELERKAQKLEHQQSEEA